MRRASTPGTTGAGRTSSKTFPKRRARAALAPPQLPPTLPTLDEALGDTHSVARAFFTSVAVAAGKARWPVLTVHAELEGGPFADDLTWFLEQGAEADLRVTTLRELLTARCATGKPLPRRTLGP